MHRLCSMEAEVSVPSSLEKAVMASGCAALVLLPPLGAHEKFSGGRASCWDVGRPQ